MRTVNRPTLTCSAYKEKWQHIMLQPMLQTLSQTNVVTNTIKLEVHSVERIYLRQRCFDASKPRVAASTGPNTSTYMGFSRRNKIPRCRVAVHTLWEKGIRFRHPDYDPDRAQKLISSSMSRRLSTRNISSKSMHAFLSNLAHRQTDKQTNERGRAGENI